MAQYCVNCYKEKVNPSAEIKNIVLTDVTNSCENCGLESLIVSDYVETEPSMTVAECQVETQKHIEIVRQFIRFITEKLTQRGVDHDASKLESPEVELFAEMTPKLSKLTYSSEEYNESLKALTPALEHHYATYRHHPEHFVNGISDMNLVDILEMFCDWKASTLRHNDGNLLKSIEINAERFNIEGQLKQILINTARMLDEQT